MAGIGVQLLEIAKLNIDLSEEDQARIDEFQDQIVQAKVEARKAKLPLLAQRLKLRLANIHSTKTSRIACDM